MATPQPAPPRGRPQPIDARGPRFNQGVLAAALLLGFVFDARWVIPAWGVVLLLSAAGGSQWGPFLRLYRDVIRPRLSPPTEIEDPRPPRFAATVGTVFLGAAVIALLLGSSGVAWGLSLVVAALAALASVTGICVGCEMYVWYKKRTAAGWHPVVAGAASRPGSGSAGVPPPASGSAA